MAESIPVQDLRSFLQLLEDRGELATIRSSVSLNQEIGAVCLRNLRNSGPGLLFERAGDHDIRLAVDLLASRRRYALALGVEADQLAAEWNRRTKNLISPVGREWPVPTACLGRRPSRFDQTASADVE